MYQPSRLAFWCLGIATLVLTGCSSIKPHQVPVVDASSYESGSRYVAPSTSSGTIDLLPPGSVQSSGRVHTVALGDTIYNISLRYGIDARQLASLNSIADPTSLRIGQQLYLPAGAKALPSAPTSSSEVVVSRVPQNGFAPKQPGAAQTSPSVIASTPAQDTVRVVKPVEPTVKPDLSGLPEKTLPGSKLIWPVAGKIVSAFGQNGKGVDIAGVKGDIIVAASEGVVLFAGSGVKGYGNLVIIKHSATLVTAYGYNDKITVKVGDKVKAGQKIAEMGVIGQQPTLRFEVRVKGKAENPRLYLPKPRR